MSAGLVPEQKMARTHPGGTIFTVLHVWFCISVGLCRVSSCIDRSRYSCMQPRMVAQWREIWSAVDGTTDPLAPFGLVTIAPSGSEGNDNKLSAFRWAQTASYGVLPNPAMPRTYVAQAYDLNDPWAGTNHNEFDLTSKTVCSLNASLPYSCAWRGTNGTSEPPPCCKCGPDFASKRCVWNISEWNRDLAPLAPLIRNSTATPQFMGSLHPRLKEPVGRRLATGLVALNYNGSGTITGPTIAGCKYDLGQHTITVQVRTCQHCSIEYSSAFVTTLCVFHGTV